MAPIRAQVVQGGNLPALIAAAAERYGAGRHQATDPGSCHCRGGTGNCPGCKPIPIYPDFHRKPGPNGREGRPGAIPKKPLFSGLIGDNGSAMIHVRHHDGTTK